jgi:hypothetical protein
MMAKTCAVLGLLVLMLTTTAWAAEPGAQRKAELAERKKDLDADVAALKKRLTLVPGYIDQFRAELQKIRAAKGINRTGVVFGPDFSMQALAENRKIADNCTASLIQFSRQLKERNVDLIVVPYIGHAEVYGHRLFKGGKASDELWPAKVEGLINLLENDVEVLDFGDAFKAYKGNGRLMGPFDHHFDSAGIEILAKELGRRIRNRYAFAKTAEAEAGRKRFTTREVRVQTPNFFLNYNKISDDEAKALNIPPTIPVEQITYDGAVDLGTRIDPVFVMGDSSVPFGAGKHDPGVGHGVGPAYPTGWGILSHLSRELGWLVPYTSDHWGGHKQVEWYARDHARTLPQPRVLILIMTGYSLNWTPEFTVHARVGGWNVVDLPPLPEAAAATPDKQAGMPAEPAKPFRAVVKLTKVSAPPDPKQTPYKEAFTVSEAKVTKLEGKVDGVAVGDTILLVEWVMKERKVLASVARQKAGETRTLTLTRWEKKINAKEEEARMIMDDTENYDARMYWVGEMPK